MILLTENLIIRPLNKDDLYSLAPLLADEDMLRFSLTGPLKNEDEAKVFLERILNHHAKYGYGLYAIVHKETERLIGMVGLFNQNIHGEPKIEIGYRLNPEFYGKGLGTEATLAVANHAFNELNIDELVSYIDSRNTRGLLFVKRIGMEFWKEISLSDIPFRIFVLNKVRVVPYDPKWESLFAEEKTKLAEALPESAFYHVGSTAIPRALARPVIDIIGTVPDLSKIELELDYKLVEEHPGQKRFNRKGHYISYNLLLSDYDDPDVERALRFTKYLKANPDELKIYSEFKKDLCKEHLCSLRNYTKEKERFTKKLDIKAALEIPGRLSAPSPVPKKKDWSEKELQEAIEANMFFHKTFFPKYVPTEMMTKENDITIIETPIRDDTFNYVLRTRFTKTNAKKRVIETLSLYSDKNLPFAWWLSSSDTPSTLEDILIENDLDLKDVYSGMALKLSPIVSKTELTFERALRQDQLLEFTKVLESVGVHKAMYADVYSRIPPSLYQEGSSLEFFIGKKGSHAIVTGILLFYAGVAGIYYVATRPEERRKGFGTQMIQHLLQRAEERGYHIAVIQPPEKEKKLYERLGFKELSKFKEYAWK